MSANRKFILVLPLLMAMRDPFLPPDDPCRLAELSRWQYHGVISTQARQIGILRDADGGWRRVTAQIRLAEGWQILQLSEREVVIATGAGCEPARWKWPREGLKNETKSTLAGDSAAATLVPGGKARFGVADGR